MSGPKGPIPARLSLSGQIAMITGNFSKRSFLIFSKRSRLFSFPTIPSFCIFANILRNAQSLLFSGSYSIFQPPGFISAFPVTVIVDSSDVSGATSLP